MFLAVDIGMIGKPNVPMAPRRYVRIAEHGGNGIPTVRHVESDTCGQYMEDRKKKKNTLTSESERNNR